MGWFSRKGERDPVATAPAEPAEGVGGSPFGTDGEVPERPVAAPLGEDERARIATALAELADSGVDVDDLASLGAGLDAAFAAWAARPEPQREGHERVIERFALGIGEHLHRHTDLRWGVVTDAFGTDLAVSGTGRGEFVVVPHNLVAVRWLRRETGWVPSVVGHLVRLRTSR